MFCIHMRKVTAIQDLIYANDLKVDIKDDVIDLDFRIMLSIFGVQNYMRILFRI